MERSLQAALAWRCTHTATERCPACSKTHGCGREGDGGGPLLDQFGEFFGGAQTGSLPTGCPSWTLPLLRGAHERTGPKLVSRSGGPPVVEDPATPRSEAPPAVAPHAAIHPTLVSRGSYLSSLSATALGRCHPRWEPDALVAPVRICGGVASNRDPYSDRAVGPKGQSSKS
jgi:hypothetical protein